MQWNDRSSGKKLTEKIMDNGLHFDPIGRNDIYSPDFAYYIANLFRSSKTIKNTRPILRQKKFKVDIKYKKLKYIYIYK